MHIARNVKKNLVAERTANGFTVEVSVKWSYASFIRAEEEKCHKDFIQQFLTGVTVIPQSTVSTWLVKKKGRFNNFCDWYESTSHDTKSSFTLLVVQKHTEDSNNN